MRFPIFRQLFEHKSSTYTYILGCFNTRKAVIIDPVLDTCSRDIKLLKELDLNVVYGLNTHVHADHITGTKELKSAFPNMKSVLSYSSGGQADRYVKDKEKINFGDMELEVLETPGHTNGNSKTLYNSVKEKIFTLPDNYSIYVGHNYNGIMQSTVWEEKKWNPRLSKSEQQFVEIMKNLKLDKPSQIDIAVPANLKDGNH